MERDVFIQWGMTCIILAWLIAIIGLSFWGMPKKRRHERECRALKEAREIVAACWACERTFDETT